MSVSTRVAVEDFWEFMAFFANSFIFLLVGLRLDPGVLWGHVGAIFVAFGAVAIARALIVYTGLPIAAKFAPAVPSAWRHVIFWGGLRGSLSMVLVLALPATFEGREMMVNIVFGIVALSLFGQGLTVAPLLRLLGMSDRGETRLEYERGRAMSLSAQEALQTLEPMEDSGHVTPEAVSRLRSYYEKQANRGDVLRSANVGGDDVDEQVMEGWQQILDAEREAIRHAHHAGVIGAVVAEENRQRISAIADSLAHVSHAAEEDRRSKLETLLDDTLDS